MTARRSPLTPREGRRSPRGRSDVRTLHVSPRRRSSSDPAVCCGSVCFHSPADRVDQHRRNQDACRLPRTTVPRALRSCGADAFEPRDREPRPSEREHREDASLGEVSQARRSQPGRGSDPSGSRGTSLSGLTRSGNAPHLLGRLRTTPFGDDSDWSSSSECCLRLTHQTECTTGAPTTAPRSKRTATPDSTTTRFKTA